MDDSLLNGLRDSCTAAERRQVRSRCMFAESANTGHMILFYGISLHEPLLLGHIILYAPS